MDGGESRIRHHPWFPTRPRGTFTREPGGRFRTTLSVDEKDLTVKTLLVPLELYDPILEEKGT